MHKLKREPRKRDVGDVASETPDGLVEPWPGSSTANVQLPKPLLEKTCMLLLLLNRHLLPLLTAQ